MLDKKVDRILTTKGLAVGLGRLIPGLGQEASADPLAYLRAEAGLPDLSADLLLAPVRLDGKPAHGALSQQDTAPTEPGLAVADPSAHTVALEPATETRLKLWVTRQDFRHETPP
jgi:hypothetical protein